MKTIEQKMVEACDLDIQACRKIIVDFAEKLTEDGCSGAAHAFEWGDKVLKSAALLKAYQGAKKGLEAGAPADAVINSLRENVLVSARNDLFNSTSPSHNRMNVERLSAAAYVLERLQWIG